MDALRKYKRFFILPCILLMALLSSCMHDDELWNFDRLEKELVSGGLFILNEGNFTYGNASLSYYDPVSKELINNAFFETNALPLGDVGQSMSIRDSLGYVVMNNSGRIYVINTRTFEYVGKITGLTSPRQIHFIHDEKAYVSDLYARSMTIVNPRTLEITGYIDVSNPSGGYYQHPTEDMVQIDKYVFTNCWSFDNQVLVIDTETDRVVDSVRVIKQPNSMVVDRHENLWILSDGGFEGSPYGYEQPGLMKLGVGETEASVVFRFEPGELPSELRINAGGDTLYFLNREVYRFTPETDSEPRLWIDSPYEGRIGAGFYGLTVDPLSSELYVGDAIDFSQKGLVYRYSPEGEAIDTLRVGIAPGSFCFKP